MRTTHHYHNHNRNRNRSHRHQCHSLPLAFVCAFAILCSFGCLNCCEAFVATTAATATAPATATTNGSKGTIGSRKSCGPLRYNIYDVWRSDAVVDTMHLDEENVQSCLDDFVNSDYGTTMFGCHARPMQFGITGEIDFVEICGPEVTLSLRGKFWHKRSTVLGRAAVWLNARIPEITDVVVADASELEDIEEILDDNGDVMFQRDKRSEDFNGDRATMEYQGLDPDARGPFPASPLGSDGLKINPA